MSKTSIMIDNIEYVRKDLVNQGPDELNGLKYAIVLSRNQGVVAGYIKSIHGQTVEILRARQLWRWDSTFILQDMAENGVRYPENCKFSKELSQPMIMTEACGILYCSKNGGESIRGIAETVNR